MTVLQNKKMILSDSAIFRFWQILKALNGVVAEIAKKPKRGGAVYSFSGVLMAIAGRGGAGLIDSIAGRGYGGAGQGYGGAG